MYGMGMATIAEMLNCEYDEAKQLVDGFYEGFPKVKAWMDALQQKCRETGYVEDPWGRRRRLPDIQKPKYELIDKRGITNTTFNPLIGSRGISLAVESPLIKQYKPLFENIKNKREFNQLKLAAEKDGLVIQEWTGTIAKAERQCVNACIQGGAATLTKMAMIKIYNDPILKELDFKMAIAVHDELIGECPEENAEAAANRLSKLMIEAAAKDIVTPFKCDPTIERSWAITDYKDSIRSDYDDLIYDKGLTKNEALAQMREEHSEASDELFAEIFEGII